MHTLSLAKDFLENLYVWNQGHATQQFVQVNLQVRIAKEPHYEAIQKA